MAATLTVENPRVVSGDPLERYTGLIANGASWKAGQFLNKDASGYLTTVATDDDAGTGGGIKYQALTDQSDPGDATTEATVGIITPDTEFEGNELDGTVSQLNEGNNYAVDVTNNIVTVDVGDASNPAVRITKVGPSFNPALYASDDIKAKLRFKVLNTVIDTANA
jgi:beta-glucanase (GH16 family)